MLSYVKIHPLSYGLDKLYNNIWPWSVILTFDLATQSLVTAHLSHDGFVNIFFSNNIKFLQVIKKFIWIGKTV